MGRLPGGLRARTGRFREPASANWSVGVPKQKYSQSCPRLVWVCSFLVGFPVWSKGGNQQENHVAECMQPPAVFAWGGYQNQGRRSPHEIQTRLRSTPSGWDSPGWRPPATCRSAWPSAIHSDTSQLTAHVGPGFFFVSNRMAWNTRWFVSPCPSQNSPKKTALNKTHTMS